MAPQLPFLELNLYILISTNKMLSIIQRIKTLRKEDLSGTVIWKAIRRRIFFIIDTLYFHSLNEWNKKNRDRLLLYQNIHKGKRCFILANGPSLGKVNFSFLKNEITIGMNKVYLLEKEFGFIPTYMACIDEENQIAQSFEDYDKIDIPCFFGYGSRRYFSKKDNQMFILCSTKTKFNKNILHSFGNGASVCFTCIQIAYFMGFSEVYLIGKDHSFKFERGKKRVESLGSDNNHFSQNYYKTGQKWDIPNYKVEEHAYALSRYVFEKSGRLIKDATIGGNLNVFEKVNFESLFNKPCLIPINSLD